MGKVGQKRAASASHASSAKSVPPAKSKRVAQNGICICALCGQTSEERDPGWLGEHSWNLEFDLEKTEHFSLVFQFCPGLLDSRGARLLSLAFLFFLLLGICLLKRSAAPAHAPGPPKSSLWPGKTMGHVPAT